MATEADQEAQTGVKAAGERTDRFTADKAWGAFQYAALRTLPTALAHSRRNRRAIRSLTGAR